MSPASRTRSGPSAGSGAALLLFGNDDQRQRFLMPLLKGESQWCQGFSEPGAGSDLAGISTYAERDGSSYRITGQKLWTSGARVRGVVHGARPDRPDGRQAQGDLVLRDRDGHARASQCGRCGSRGVASGSARCSSTRPRPSRTGSATRATGGRWRTPCSPTSGGRRRSGVVATWKSELAARHAHKRRPHRDQVRHDEVAVEACRLRRWRASRSGASANRPDRVLGRQAAHDPSRTGVGVLGDGHSTRASGVTGADSDATLFWWAYKADDRPCQRGDRERRLSVPDLGGLSLLPGRERASSATGTTR